MSVFQWTARVYWEDTDGGGIVYYANYLKFLERARTEWLRSLGFFQTQLARDEGLVFTVVNLEVDYRRPARLDDELTITCVPRASGSASIRFTQRVYRGAMDPQLLAEAERASPTDASVFARLAQAQAAVGGTSAGAAIDKSLADRLLVEARVRVACVDAQSLRPRRMPDFLLNVLPAKELS